MHISIIIPTYNRCEILKETLESFLLLKHNENDFGYEIIVVDNNSNDNTRIVVMSFKSKLPIKYLHEPKQGKNYAVNKGIEISKGDIIVFVDDDVTVNNDWFFSIYESTMKYSDVNIFGGKILTHWPKNTPSWVHYSSENFPFLFCDHNLGNEEKQYTDSPLPGGANFWLRRRVLEKYKTKFNVQYGPSGNKRVAGSETEFLKRMYDKGEKILYIPDAVVSHRVLPEEFQILKLLSRFAATGKSSLRNNTIDTSRAFFNIPLYLYNQLLTEMFLFLLNFITFNKNKYMNSMIKIAYFYGRSKAFVAGK